MKIEKKKVKLKFSKKNLAVLDQTEAADVRGGLVANTKTSDCWSDYCISVALEICA